MVVVVASVLAFYSDDLSSNTAEGYNFSVKLCLERTKINKKSPGLAHFFVKKIGRYRLTIERIESETHLVFFAGISLLGAKELKIDSREGLSSFFHQLFHCVRSSSHVAGLLTFSNRQQHATTGNSKQQQSAASNNRQQQSTANNNSQQQATTGNSK